MQNHIKSIAAREILDSRGNPTLWVRVETTEGAVGVASVPSGASTGKYEAVEKRDDDGGMQAAITAIHGEIADTLVGKSLSDDIDAALIALDGTEQKERLGGNALLGVSLACARAAAVSKGMPLWRSLGGKNACSLPMPLMNILNGGAHADNGLDIQEFMIVPIGAESFRQALQMGVAVYRSLKQILKEQKLGTGLGDEGGFAPALNDERAALELLLTAVEQAGLVPGRDIGFALDAAASEWETEGGYLLPKSGKMLSADELTKHYLTLATDYPLLSIEDPFGQEDWDAFADFTASTDMQVVGDDLFVTNPDRLQEGIRRLAATALLVKPNQVGTLRETMQAVRLAHRAGMQTVLSHRSGETEDTTIADLAVGLGSSQIKAGAPARGERVAKYNRLLHIEAQLGERAEFRRWEL